MKARSTKPLRMSNKLISSMIQSYGSEDAVVEAALAIVAKRAARPQDQHTVESPEDAKKYLALTIGDLPYEAYWALYLGPQAQVLAAEEVARGDAGSVTSPNKVILKRALELDAFFVVTAHNHPGSRAEPSDDDMSATMSLGKMLRLIDVRLLDSYVIAGSQVTSIVLRMQEQLLEKLKSQVPASIVPLLEKAVRENLRPGNVQPGAPIAVTPEMMKELEAHAGDLEETLAHLASGSVTKH